MEQMGLNCFSLNELEGLRGADFGPKQPAGTHQFRVKSRSISGDSRAEKEEKEETKACAGNAHLQALELRHFRKVEIFHLHRRDHHVHRLFSAARTGTLMASTFDSM
jgi:hypothetical protein